MNAVRLEDGIALSLRDITTELTLGFGLTPSYRFGRTTLFGGIYWRNHPTIERKGEEFSESNHEDVDSGPANMLLHAGVSVQLGKSITGLVLVHQDVTPDPVRYGPGILTAFSNNGVYYSPTGDNPASGRVYWYNDWPR